MGQEGPLSATQSQHEQDYVYSVSEAQRWLLRRRHKVRRRHSHGVALPSLGFLLLLALGALVGAVLLVDDGGVDLKITNSISMMAPISLPSFKEILSSSLMSDLIAQL